MGKIRNDWRDKIKIYPKKKKSSVKNNREKIKIKAMNKL